MNQHANPNDGQLATLGALDPEAPVAALNLFQFNSPRDGPSSR